jgi:hypothetical protein
LPARRVRCAIASKCGKAGGYYDGLVNRRARTFLEIAQQPASGDPRMPARVLTRDQHGQLERIAEADLWEILRGCLSSEQVPAFKGLLENPVWTALRGRHSSSPGPRRPSDSRTKPPAAVRLGCSDELKGMKRFLTWFNGQSRTKRVLMVSAIPLLVLVFFIDLWTTPSSGRVLAEGKNLGIFETSENPSKFDPAHARRFVITKIEAFGPGVLDDFPPDCSPNTCKSAPPDKQPVVVIWAEPEPRCSGGSAADFEACVTPLTEA